MANRRRIGNLVGIAIGLLGLGFVGIRLADDWPSVTEALSDANWWLVALALILGLAGMTTIGLNWHFILRDLGAEVPSVQASLHQYFVGQLGKYVPGGIWPIVGRAEMAHRGGASRTAAYGGTLMSLAATYLASLLTAALLLASSLLRGDSPSWAVWLLFLIPVGILLLHPRALNWAIGWMSRVLKRELSIQLPSWSRSITTIALHVPSWLAISGATWLISKALGGDVGFDLIGVATCIAWFLGFVVIGLPGGIGVREAVFVSLASPLGPSLAATVALVARAIFVIVDLVGAGLSTGIHWARASETPKPGPG